MIVIFFMTYFIELQNWITTKRFSNHSIAIQFNDILLLNSLRNLFLPVINYHRGVFCFFKYPGLDSTIDAGYLIC